MRYWNYLQFSLGPQDLDCASVIITEMGTQGIHEQSVESGQVLLKAYFDPSQDIQKVVRHFKRRCWREAVFLHSCTAKVEKERDWQRKWRRDLKPFLVGERFLISPRRHFENPGLQDRIAIWVEPRMAFGTGTHETTQLCLETIERLSLRDKTVLDIGTGSGILAIACAKLGAGRILACDIDPVAIAAAHTNCRRNHTGERVGLVGGDIDAIGRSQFDVILANLDQRQIRQKLEIFGRHLKPTGRMVLSGLLRKDCDQIGAEQAGRTLKVSRRRSKGEWCCLLLRPVPRARSLKGNL